MIKGVCDTYVALSIFSMNISVAIVERKLKKIKDIRDTFILIFELDLKERLDFDTQNLKTAERRRFFHSILSPPLFDSIVESLLPIIPEHTPLFY